MNDQTMISGAKKNATLFIILGGITVLLGLISMLAPLMTGVAVTVLVGSLLLISGVLQVFHSFRVLGTGTKIFAMLVGILAVIAGCLVLARPLFVLKTLTLILAGFFIADGLLTCIAAMKGREHRGWGWLLFHGAISLLLGILIWRQWPVSGTWAIGVLVGVRILTSGLDMIFVGSTTRYIAREAEKEPETQ